MAGRGRAKGRGLSFSVETLGFGRGEALPGSILQPPPLFPALDFKPLPLSSGEEYDYLLALKQEFRSGMKESPYFIKPSEKKKDIERYSDKYTASQENGDAWKPDWSLLPDELKENKKKRRKREATRAAVKPNLPSVSRNVAGADGADIAVTLEKLEKQEGEQEEDPTAEKKDGEQEEGEEEEEEEYYEDDMEEETDYNLNYFDNGEGFGADEDDDLEEGPVY